jgi:hypothetical protein
MKKTENNRSWSRTWTILAAAIQDQWLAGSDTSKKGRPRIAAFVLGAGVCTYKESGLISAFDNAATNKAEPSDEVLKAICAALAKHIGDSRAPTPQQLRSLPGAELEAFFNPKTELYLAPGQPEFLLGPDLASIDAFVPQGYTVEVYIEWMIEPIRSQDGRYAFGPDALIIATDVKGSQELRIEPMTSSPFSFKISGQTLHFERVNVRAAARWRISTDDLFIKGLFATPSPLFKLDNAKPGDSVTVELRVERDSQRLKVVPAENVTGKSTHEDTIDKKREEIMEAVFRRAQRAQGASTIAEIGLPHVTLARVTATVRERLVGATLR